MMLSVKKSVCRRACAGERVSQSVRNVCLERVSHSSSFKAMLKKLVLAAVPEQVNIPILLCQERGIFAKHGLEVVHRVVPEGTGKMLDMLESGEVDVALTVTDGFVAGKAAGRRVSLAGTFVESPLIWAVAASARSSSSSSSSSAVSMSDLASLPKCRFGISRLGSGSHTMGIYTGKHVFPPPLFTQPPRLLEFVVANNFQQLRDGAHADLFDVFMWETFTTKPFFDSGELKKLGEVVTPWPAFSFVTASGCTDAAQEDIKQRLFPALAEGVALFVGRERRDAMIERICQDHGHKEQDARLWMDSCRYAVHEGIAPMAVNRDVMARAVDILKEAALVPADFVAQDL